MKKIFALFQICLASQWLMAQEAPCSATTVPLQACATGSPSYTTITIGSTSDIPAAVSTCNDGGRDSWAKIVVPAGVEGVAIYVDDYGGCSGFACFTDLRGEWYAEGASCSSLTQFGSCFNLDDDGAVVARLYGIPSTGGTYYIRITEDDNQGGWVRLAAMRNSGDIVSAPIPLATATGDYCNFWANGSDCSAVTSGGCIGTIDNSIFYSFTVTSSTPQPITFSLDNISCAGSMQMAVVNAACGTRYASLCSITTSSQTLTTSGTLANGNYLFVVDGTAGDDCSWQINSSLTCEIGTMTSTLVSNSCNNNGTGADLTDDYYLANVTVNFTGRPVTGTLNLSGAALHSTNTVSSVAVGSTTSTTSHTFSNVRLKANGTANSLTASFSAVSSTCTKTISTTSVAALPASATISGTTSVCSPATTTLSVTSGAGYTYTWAATSGGTISGSTAGSSIVATTSGTYNVTVSNAAGCNVTNSQVVSVNTVVAPTVTGPTALCAGAPVTLDAGAGYTTYLWAATSGGTITGGTSSRTITATTVGTYNVTVTGAGGCSATGSKVISTSVANPATPSISGANTVCAGASATIDAGPGYTTYIWAATGGGATSGSTTSQSLLAVGAGTYSVTVTNTGGCTATASKVITAQSAIDICENGTLTASQTGAFTTGGYRVNYFFVAAGVVKAKNTTGIFDLAAMGITAAANATNCLVYVVNDDGTATLPAVNAAYSVTGTCFTQTSSCLTINAPTPVTITGVPTVCSGTATSLTATAGASYQWGATAGGTIGGSSTGQSISATTAGTYKVTLTNAAGCKSVSSDLVVSTFANPATPSIQGQSALCTAGQASLDAGLGYTTYLWSNGNTTQTSLVTGPGTYAVTVSNTAQCTATASKVVASDTPVDVCENGAFTAAATGNFTTSGYRTTYFVVADGSVVDKNTSGTFNLTAMGLTAVANATNSLVYVVNDDGNATLPAIGAAYSVSGACFTQTSKCLTINATPVAVISGPASFCAGGNATLTATAGFTNYAWSTPTGAISGSTNGASALVTTSGTYYVTTTDNKGCKVVKSQLVSEIAASTNVVLATSSINTVPLTPACDLSGWTYYANPSNPSELYFAINWAPDGSLSSANSTAKAAASVTLGVAQSSSNFLAVPGTPGYYGADNTTSQYATFVMPRYWNVNTAGNTFDEPVNVRFYYDVNEKNATNQAATGWQAANGGVVEPPIWFKTVSSGSTNNPFNPDTDITDQSVEAGSITLTPFATSTENGVEYVQFNALTGFSGGSFSSGVQPSSLPIELLYFTGRTVGEQNHLKWATATEENTDYFELQRSSDGVRFEPIANLPAAGYSTQTLNYSHVDGEPLIGNNYYRLKAVDFDATFSLSHIINLPFFKDEIGVANVYPNPTNGKIYLDIYAPQADNIQVQLTDAIGQYIRTEYLNLGAGMNTRQLDVSDLASGVYFLNFQCCDGKNFQHRFVKGY